jgi:pimeloyl-[acyl-carrier protein] methyl ester esterase
VRDDSWPHAQQRAAIEAVGASLDSAFEQTLERFLACR